jgi:hypothetical protein
MYNIMENIGNNRDKEPVPLFLFMYNIIEVICKDEKVGNKQNNERRGIIY